MANHQHFTTMAKNIATSSAMNPALLLCLMVVPLSLALASFLFHSGLILPGTVFTIVAIAPIAIACWQLIHFTNTAPDRLQREEHIQKMFEMQHFGVREGDNVREIMVSSDMSNNPRIATSNIKGDEDE